MTCANCRRQEPPAYTLKAHVEGDEGTSVDLRFCSIECLDTWT